MKYNENLQEAKLKSILKNKISDFRSYSNISSKYKYEGEKSMGGNGREMEPTFWLSM